MYQVSSHGSLNNALDEIYGSLPPEEKTPYGTVLPAGSTALRKELQVRSSAGRGNK